MIEKLKAQLVATEAEFEQAKGHVHQCVGAIQILKHLIAEAEAAEKKEVSDVKE